MSVTLRYAARSDVGLVRSTNQDSGYAGPHLLVLADGMGGPAGGDIASSVAIAHLAHLDDEVHPAEELLDLLRRSVEGAHNELIERAHNTPELAGLGTTCIALLRSGNKLAMVHIGDSRAYLLRGGQLSQVTTDHTFVQYLVDSGRLTPEEAAHHPQRNVIMRALGDTDGRVELDESMREARLGDRWLLCSDGLFGVVSEETISQTLAHVHDLDECAETLVELALRGGAPDNVTCIVADVIDQLEVADGTFPTPQVVGSAAKNPSALRRQSDSAAGRAASLLKPTKDAGAPREDAAKEGPRRLRRGQLSALAAVVVALVVAALGYVGFRWTQTQYYVAESDGNVAIYQGIPQDIGPLKLHSLYERTGIPVDSLTKVAQDRLAETITRRSLEEAQEAVAVLAEQQRELPEPAGEGAEQPADPAGPAAPPADSANPAVEGGGA